MYKHVQSVEEGTSEGGIVIWSCIKDGEGENDLKIL